MRFEWDRHNLKEIAAHGVTSDQVEQAMRGEHHATGPVLSPTGEKRWTASARLFSLAIVYTKRKGCIRVITAYPSRKVRKRYETE